MTTSPTFVQEQTLLMPWLPSELVDIYTEAYVEYGQADLAWAAVQSSEAYDRYFPGNRREDGTLRLDEQTYASTIEAYDDVFLSVGLNPRLFNEQYVSLIEGDVSPAELARDRVQPIYDRIIEGGSAAIMEYYATNYGLDMTPEAILAAALDPNTVGVAILSKQIAMSEIGGEAAESGFEINAEFADVLFKAGLDRNQADQMFKRAESFVPILSVLAARNADPDDDFDIQNFVSADLFQDPQQMSRMRRLMAQERSRFTGGAQIEIAKDQQGGVSGLRDL